MFNCYCHTGTCLLTVNPLFGGGTTLPAALFAGPVKGPLVLSAPIGDGPKARNVYTDVAGFQRALNALLPGDRGSLLNDLVVDGLCGPLTKNALQQFQIRHFGWAGADRLMEPGKQTLAKLNELLATNQFVAPTLADIARAVGIATQQIQDGFDQSFAMAKRWIRAGYVRTLNPSPDALIEKYFQLTRQSNPQRARSQVALIFGRLNTFFSHPGGLWGEQAFEPEPKIRTDAGTPYAWCTPGGYFMQGQKSFVPMDDKETLFPAREDTIYYTLRFVLYMSNVERAYCIVHELCHFVSQAPEIRDTVYAHRDPPRFAGLPAAQRLSNTDHYAMLAYEAGTGEGNSPIRAG